MIVLCAYYDLLHFFREKSSLMFSTMQKQQQISRIYYLKTVHHKERRLTFVGGLPLRGNICTKIRVRSY